MSTLRKIFLLVFGEKPIQIQIENGTITRMVFVR